LLDERRQEQCGTWGLDLCRARWSPSAAGPRGIRRRGCGRLAGQVAQRDRSPVDRPGPPGAAWRRRHGRPRPRRGGHVRRPLRPVAATVAAIASVWSLVLPLLEPATISQDIERGFWGALNPRAVIRRVRVNLALSIVVGALVVVLTTIGLIGLAAIAIGVLVTFPYASYIGAYLIGRYARLTTPPTLRAEAIDG